MTALFADGVPRGAAAGLFALLADLFARDWRRTLTARLGVLLTIAGLAYLVLPTLSPDQDQGTELFPRGMADNPFWGLFTTTVHHDLHHSGGFNHNYGLYFTWWDRMMGTEHPRYREIFREVTARGARESRGLEAARVKAI